MTKTNFGSLTIDIGRGGSFPIFAAHPANRLAVPISLSKLRGSAGIKDADRGPADADLGGSPPPEQAHSSPTPSSPSPILFFDAGIELRPPARSLAASAPPSLPRLVQISRKNLRLVILPRPLALPALAPRPHAASAPASPPPPAQRRVQFCQAAADPPPQPLPAQLGGAPVEPLGLNSGAASRPSRWRWLPSSGSDASSSTSESDGASSDAGGRGARSRPPTPFCAHPPGTSRPFRSPSPLPPAKALRAAAPEPPGAALGARPSFAVHSRRISPPVLPSHVTSRRDLSPPWPARAANDTRARAERGSAARPGGLAALTARGTPVAAGPMQARRSSVPLPALVRRVSTLASAGPAADGADAGGARQRRCGAPLLAAKWREQASLWNGRALVSCRLPPFDGGGARDAHKGTAADARTPTGALPPLAIACCPLQPHALQPHGPSRAAYAAPTRKQSRAPSTGIVPSSEKRLGVLAPATAARLAGALASQAHALPRAAHAQPQPKQTLARRAGDADGRARVAAAQAAAEAARQAAAEESAKGALVERAFAVFLSLRLSGGQGAALGQGGCADSPRECWAELSAVAQRCSAAAAELRTGAARLGTTPGGVYWLLQRSCAALHPASPMDVRRPQPLALRSASAALASPTLVPRTPADGCASALARGVSLCDGMAAARDLAASKCVAAELAVALGLSSAEGAGAPTLAQLVSAAAASRARAEAIRTSIRLKLEDEADVELALQAVDEAAAFVGQVRERARLRREHPAVVFADVLAAH